MHRGSVYNGQMQPIPGEKPSKLNPVANLNAILNSILASSIWDGGIQVARIQVASIQAASIDYASIFVPTVDRLEAMGCGSGAKESGLA